MPTHQSTQLGIGYKETAQYGAQVTPVFLGAVPGLALKICVPGTPTSTLAKLGWLVSPLGPLAGERLSLPVSDRQLRTQHEHIREKEAP